MQHVSGQHILDSYIAAINRGSARFWCIPAASEDSQYVAFLLAKQRKNKAALQESIEMAQNIASKYNININYKKIREYMIKPDTSKHDKATKGIWKSCGYLFDCKQKECANDIQLALNNLLLEKFINLHCTNICRLVLPEFGEHYIKTYVSQQNRAITGPKYTYRAEDDGKPQIFSINTNLIIYLDSNNDTLRACKRCGILHINNYDVKKKQYEIALKLVGLECIKDVIISFVLYSTEYINVLMQLKMPFILKNNAFKGCEGCGKLRDEAAGVCSVCCKQMQNIDNYGVVKEKYELALKWTELECLKDVIISFVLYPSEYYDEYLNESDELMMKKQLVFDDWYQYSEKNGKLKKSINIIKKMILKQNRIEFIRLLIELQAWMTCKQIWEITQCLPSVDDNMINNNSDNARKIIALMYFGMNFFENDGKYIENIKIFLMNNCKNPVVNIPCYDYNQLFKIFNFTKGPYWKLLGKHVYKNHISHRIVRDSVNDISLWASTPPIINEQTLLMMTSGW